MEPHMFIYTVLVAIIGVISLFCIGSCVYITKCMTENNENTINRNNPINNEYGSACERNVELKDIVIN